MFFSPAPHLMFHIFRAFLDRLRASAGNSATHVHVNCHIRNPPKKHLLFDSFLKEKDGKTSLAIQKSLDMVAQGSKHSHVHV